MSDSWSKCKLFISCSHKPLHQSYCDLDVICEISESQVQTPNIQGVASFVLWMTSVEWSEDICPMYYVSVVCVVWKLDARIPLFVGPPGAYHLLSVRSLYYECCAHHTQEYNTTAFWSWCTSVCWTLVLCLRSPVCVSPCAYCTQYNHTQCSVCWTLCILCRTPEQSSSSLREMGHSVLDTVLR